jgi:hypothetical protein
VQNFSAHRLRFVTEAQSTIELNEHQGSALRGALFWALRHKFCAFAHQRDAECAPAQGAACALAPTCPVARLVSTLDTRHPRGRDRPRPYTIQPPIQNSPFAGQPCEHPDGRVTFRYEPGETLTFGLTLYADAMALFPYVVLAMQGFEDGGLGRKVKQRDGRWRRGTLKVREVWAENPLTGERQPVIRQGERQVHVPDVPVTHAQIKRMANTDSPIHHSPFTIHFLTPTRLVDKGQLLKPETFHFRPFFQRLLERLEALSETFTDTPLDVDFPALLAVAETARVVDNRLSWQEVRSYSTRRHRALPRGGLTGTVTLQAPDWQPFLPWLLWGQFTHVGKDAVKGNGMYRI